MFLLAIYSFDWTHIHAESNDNYYHVFLLSAHDEYDSGDWLFNINADCFSELGKPLYPVELCARVGTLSMAGFFVILNSNLSDKHRNGYASSNKRVRWARHSLIYKKDDHQEILAGKILLLKFE